MLTSEGFDALARIYGRVGGLDRIATLVRSIRAERDGRVLLLDGGDSWQGSWGALQTRGEDMVQAMAPLGVDAMVGHREFTYGEARVQELVTRPGAVPFLAQNIRDTGWEEPVFPTRMHFERGGVSIAVIGQAFPYTPVANPRWLMPNGSFGIRESGLRAEVARAREAGAGLVVLLSHNGFDVDYRLASRVEGIDVILSGHTHDALPQVTQVGRTLLVASGTNGKFLSRLDLEVRKGQVAAWRYRLIPVLADVIPPDPEVAAIIGQVRRPFVNHLQEVVGRTGSLLYRRGNLAGSFDDVICDALLERRDAGIALSPGFRWGPSLLPDQEITREFVHAHTAIPDPRAWRQQMTGRQLHAILEDVADNLFHPDPYYQQGGDMVRTGGPGFRIRIGEQMGKRIQDLTLLSSGQPIEADRTYQVAGWASVNPEIEGPDIHELVTDWIRDRQEIRPRPGGAVRIEPA